MHGISERSATPEQFIYANARSIAFEMGQNCRNDDFFRYGTGIGTESYRAVCACSVTLSTRGATSKFLTRPRICCA